jgi:hypothetical protein
LCCSIVPIIVTLLVPAAKSAVARRNFSAKALNRGTGRQMSRYA